MKLSEHFVLEEFDRIIGLDRLKVIHVNDSKNPQGASKDRHENIGFGEIGFDALNAIVHHPKLAHLPKILETPFVGEDKKNKKETKKSKKLIKNRKEFIEDNGDDTIDPNECPERFVKLREQFIKEDYK